MVPMTREFAAQMVSWEYPAPYETYSLTSSEPEFFLDVANGYFAIVDEGHELLGYRCFGPDGRVPGWGYDDSALDTGGGMRPDLTGRGLGRTALEVGLQFGRERYDPPAFRVTVAAWNERALRVVRALGFADVATFRAANTGAEYAVLMRTE